MVLLAVCHSLKKMTTRPITIPLKTATASIDDLNSPQKNEAGSIAIHKKIKLKGENYLVVGSQDYVKASNPNSRFTRVILGIAASLI